MTDEQINTKIAEVCGWRQLRDGRWKRNGRVERGVPDYCNDLNAMHEAEKTLSIYDISSYWEHLLQVHELMRCWAACSTARQRAEALLLTLNHGEE